MRPFVVVATALATVVLADVAAGVIAPPRNLREVEDAITELRGSAPTVVAIGSSHGRTFAVLGDSLLERTGGRERMLAVPVEWGKLSSYRWVLEERLLPLLDARGEDGQPRARRLARAIIVTEWWDSCEGAARARNLPARAWSWPHWIEDVRTEGITPYNDNFLAYRWARWTRWSALMQDRGQGRILSEVRQRLAPDAPEDAAARFRQTAQEWQHMIETGDRCIGSAREMGALTAMVDTLLGRGLEVTVLLYPRMPATLSDAARRTTLPHFAAGVAATLASRPVRIVDLTSTSPLEDSDFGGDFDHLVPAGNARFSRWALDGPLAFLVEPRR